MTDKKVKANTLTYEVGDGLYINPTNKCTNNCSFCIRNNGDGAYGSDSLWLVREPCEEELFSAVFSRDLGKYREVVFCGYGEPSMRLDICAHLATAIKERYPEMPVRINTNGQSDLYFSRDTAPDFRVFDTVSISLNAPTPERYNEICQSRFGNEALPAIIKFAKRVKEYTRAVFSVVAGTVSDSELEECRRIAAECGIELRVREYISK